MLFVHLGTYLASHELSAVQELRKLSSTFATAFPPDFWQKKIKLCLSLYIFKFLAFAFVFLKEKFSLSCVANSNIQELMRCIRSQSESLLTGLPQKELTAMSLGLAHRYFKMLSELTWSFVS